MVLDEFSLGPKAYEINRVSAELARACANEFSTEEKPRFVAGSIGPTTKALSVTGGIDFDGLVAQFEVQVKGLYDGGVDYFLIETAQDTRNVKAAVFAIQNIHKKYVVID